MSDKVFQENTDPEGFTVLWTVTTVKGVSSNWTEYINKWIY